MSVMRLTAGYKGTQHSTAQRCWPIRLASLLPVSAHLCAKVLLCQHLGQLGFAYTSRPNQQHSSSRPVGVLEAHTRTAQCSNNTLNCVILANHTLLHHRALQATPTKTAAAHVFKAAVAWQSPDRSATSPLMRDY